MVVGTIMQIQVGQLQWVQDGKRKWPSAIDKTVVETAYISTAGLIGDEQSGDVKDMERAVSCHPATHYRFWQAYYQNKIQLGAFGENITLGNISDEDVCIGDIFRCGEALLQVSQPRTPCFKPAQRIGEPDLVKRIEQTGKRGWLMRVLEEGEVNFGSTYNLIERAYHDMTLPYINRKFHDRTDSASAINIANIPALGKEYRQHFLAIANSG